MCILLKRDFDASKLFEKLGADVTEFWIANAKAHLATICDMASRRSSRGVYLSIPTLRSEVVPFSWTVSGIGGTALRYSMEQRRRAVDLYVRFDCSAADTIRELGYPSKGALLMWHRDRLVEERTGMPVMRGERYGRYTVEQKQAAVEFYLSHGRNLRRTMRHMGYPSHEVLAAWIDELAPGNVGSGWVRFLWSSARLRCGRWLLAL